MKKSITKLVMFAGFILAIIGIIVDAMISEMIISTTLLYLPAVFAICFINSKNNVLINFGYCLAGILGALGLAGFMVTDLEGSLVTTLGYIVMSISSVFYLITLILNFFGFVKKGKSDDGEGNIVAVLNKYKELEKEKVITADEFEGLKSKALKCAESEKYSVEDLKKWKKLFDQQIITEEEFSSVKNKIFKA